MRLLLKYELLTVENDPSHLKNIVIPLKKVGFNITAAENGTSAIEILDKKYFDIVLIDLGMSFIDGFRVLKKAKKMEPICAVIMLTAYRDINFVKDALRLGAHDFLIKPCEPAELLYRVEKCLGNLESEWKIQLYERILPVCCACKKI